MLLLSATVFVTQNSYLDERIEEGERGREGNRHKERQTCDN